MPKYAALLRGIGPGNPNMKNEKLRGVFEDLGFTNVRSVISSGNILFESKETVVKTLEEKVQKAFPEKLGFNCSTIIKTQDKLEKLVKLNPFKGLSHGTGSYLLVTFLKRPVEMPFTIPYQPEGKPYRFVAATKDVIFSVTDNTVITTSDLMTWLEKQFGKDITSRTWLTIDRIFKKLNEI